MQQPPDCQFARPSIYEKPKRPLVRKYPKAYRVQSRDFEMFFRELAEGAKQPLDKGELRRLLAIGVGSKPMDVKIEYDNMTVSSGFHKYLSGSLFLRSVHIHYTGDAGKATEFALNAIMPLGDWKYWPFNVDPTEERRINWLLSSLHRNIPNSNLDEIGKMLDAYNAPCERKIQSDVEVNAAVLEKFAKEIRSGIRYEPLGAIYPHGLCNLKAVFGADVETSSLDSLFEEKARSFTPNHIAVLLQNPCEASHLEKARLMLERGARVEKPLGKMLVDGMEFALFQWVPGESLLSSYGDRKSGLYHDETQKLAAWEAYGRFVRFCHNKGIALDDAAGRNAIWDGTGITGIDFEHTWFSMEAKPLAWADRREAVYRVRGELGGNLHPLYEAFRRGYDAHMPSR